MKPENKTTEHLGLSDRMNKDEDHAINAFIPTDLQWQINTCVLVNAKFGTILNDYNYNLNMLC